MTDLSLFHRMLHKYENLESYSDCGIVTQMGIEDEFRTTYRKPDSFRYEWDQHHPYIGLNAATPCAVWTEGNAVWLKIGERTEKQESLSVAIKCAAAGSCVAPLVVSRLVIRELNGWSLHNVNDLDLESNGTGKIRNQQCGIFKCTWSDFHDTEVWISSQDQSLRRFKHTLAGRTGTLLSRSGELIRTTISFATAGAISRAPFREILSGDFITDCIFYDCQFDHSSTPATAETET